MEGEAWFYEQTMSYVTLCRSAAQQDILFRGLPLKVHDKDALDSMALDSRMLAEQDRCVHP